MPCPFDIPCEFAPKQSFEGMTNGEVMRTVFPHIRAFPNGFEGDMYGGIVDVYGIGIDDEDVTLFSLEWWNELYKGGEE